MTVRAGVLLWSHAACHAPRRALPTRRRQRAAACGASRKGRADPEALSYQPGVSYNDVADDAQTGLRSCHPDAIKRRQRAERRKEKRRMIYDAISHGLEWWQIVKDCSENIVLATCSDEFYHAIRVARANKRDVIVQYFSPRCFACKDEAVQCAQIASENPDKTFVRVHYEKCRAVCQSHKVTKLPFVQYFRHDQKDPVLEDHRLCSLDALLQVPENLDLAAQGRGGAYCTMEHGQEVVVEAMSKSFDTLLQAIQA